MALRNLAHRQVLDPIVWKGRCRLSPREQDEIQISLLNNAVPVVIPGQSRANIPLDVLLQQARVLSPPVQAVSSERMVQHPVIDTDTDRVFAGGLAETGNIQYCAGCIGHFLFIDEPLEGEHVRVDGLDPKVLRIQQDFAAVQPIVQRPGFAVDRVDDGLPRDGVEGLVQFQHA
jgi:hypothetical protein